MRAYLLLAVCVALAPIAASAQVYPGSTPLPRTTSLPALRDLATRREIEERFTIALDEQMRGDWQTAIPELERIVALKPAEPQGSTAHYDLALSYAHLQRYRDAAGEFERALALDPGFLAAMANLISVDIAAGRLSEARGVADRFAAVAPDSARALYSRGLVALQTGDAQTARRDFGRMLANDPSYAIAHYDLALAEIKLESFSSAERELRAALQLSPCYARARLALGTVLLREGRKSEARDAFAQASQDAAGDPALRDLAASLRDAIVI